ncbi:hypothetical protein THAOC_32891, partial [Thalassiosira oceanica]
PPSPDDDGASPVGRSAAELTRARFRRGPVRPGTGGASSREPVVPAATSAFRGRDRVPPRLSLRDGDGAGSRTARARSGYVDSERLAELDERITGSCFSYNSDNNVGDSNSATGRGSAVSTRDFFGLSMASNALSLLVNWRDPRPSSKTPSAYNILSSSLSRVGDILWERRHSARGIYPLGLLEMDCVSDFSKSLEDSFASASAFDDLSISTARTRNPQRHLARMRAVLAGSVLGPAKGTHGGARYPGNAGGNEEAGSAAAAAGASYAEDRGLK